MNSSRDNNKKLTCSLGAFRRLAAGARARVNARMLGTSADRCPGGSMARHREMSFCPLVSSRTVERTRRSSEASRVEASGAGFPSAWKGSSEGGWVGGGEGFEGYKPYMRKKIGRVADGEGGGGGRELGKIEVDVAINSSQYTEKTRVTGSPFFFEHLHKKRKFGTIAYPLATSSPSSSTPLLSPFRGVLR